MVRCKTLALLLLFATAAVAPAGAEDDLAQSIYASMEQRVRAEYESSMAAIARMPSTEPDAKRDQYKNRISLFYYNKAGLFALCAAEAEQGRSPNAPRVPSSQNLLLTTCVETKFDELERFTQLLGYADIFFPERIAPCGERARLPALEQRLKPYGFLQLAEPKLFDFPLYNRCLMTPP